MPRVNPDLQVAPFREAVAAALPRAMTALVSAVEAAPDHRRRTQAARNGRPSTRTAGAQPRPQLNASDVSALESILVPLMDPMIALGAVQARVRDQRVESQETEAADSANRAEIAEAERQQQLEKARRALEKKMRGLPRWLKGLIGAVVAAIGAVASAVTGGASVVLAGVALAFLLAGDVVNALVARGILPAKPASYIAIGLKIVGAVLSSIATLGAGGASSAATISSAAADWVKLADTVAQITKACVEVADGAIAISNSVKQFRADMAQAQAALQAAIRDEAREDIEDAVADMRGIHQSFTRVMQRLRLAVDAGGESGMTAANA